MSRAPATETVAAPTVIPDRYQRPARWWSLAIQPGLSALVAASVSPRAYDALAGLAPGATPPRRTLQRITAGLAVLHAGEAVVAYRRARAAGMVRSAPRWALNTLISGFPVLLKLRAVTAR
jgi:hypothetical protein